MMKKEILFGCLAALGVANVFASVEVPLNSRLTLDGAEKQFLWPEGAVSDETDRPFLQWYETPKGVMPTNVCALILSGGAYERLGDVESFRPYVDQLLSNGIHCACLFYRTPRPKTGPIYARAWADGQRAVRILRHEASQRGYDPERIGAVGASAGGHLAVLLGANSRMQAYAPVDSLDTTPCHLNWAVPICPAYVLTDGLTGINVKDGEGPDAKVDWIFAFDERTCPMCFFHGGKDVHSPLASTQLYRYLRRRGVPAELHLAADRGHGFMPVPEFERALEFLRQMEILGKLGPQENHDHRFFFDDTIRTEKEPLWPSGKTPDFSKDQTEPYLVWFFPERQTTAAIQVIAPGGAYMSCNFNGECTPVAHYLNGKGMTAVVLMYRHPRPAGKPKYLSAWQDAQRAVRLVRAGAKRRGLDPDRIGIMGFSAGGHLALMTAVCARTPAYAPVDDIDTLSCDVQWACPIYPGYVLTDNNQDKLSLTGGNADTDVLSPELRFDAATPPMCFVHGDADFVPAMNSVKVWEKLRRMGIQGDLHTLARRSHCFQVVSSPGTGSWTWMDRVWEFLRRSFTCRGE